MEADEKLRRLEKILAELKENWIFVEGLRDRKALNSFGLRNILTISGNLRLSCERLHGHAQKVVILTDLDRRGDQLAALAVDELGSHSIKADLSHRKLLGRLLNIRHFEDARIGYERLIKEVEENG